MHGPINIRMPDTIDTVIWAPEDGWRYYPKNLEQFADINKLYIVASCWVIIDTYMLFKRGSLLMVTTVHTTVEEMAVLNKAQQIQHYDDWSLFFRVFGFQSFVDVHYHDIWVSTNREDS